MPASSYYIVPKHRQYRDEWYNNIPQLCWCGIYPKTSYTNAGNMLPLPASSGGSKNVVLPEQSEWQKHIKLLRLRHLQLKQLCEQLEVVEQLHLTEKKGCVVDEVYYADLNLVLNDFSQRKPWEFLENPVFSIWTTAAGRASQTHWSPQWKWYSDVQKNSLFLLKLLRT